MSKSRPYEATGFGSNVCTAIVSVTGFAPNTTYRVAISGPNNSGSGPLTTGPDGSATVATLNVVGPGNVVATVDGVNSGPAPIAC